MGTERDAPEDGADAGRHEARAAGDGQASEDGPRAPRDVQPAARDGRDAAREPDHPAERIEELIRRHEAGDARAFDALVPLLMGELRRMAHARVSRLAGDVSMHTTVLINEVYLKFRRAQDVRLNDVEHLRALLARAMRQVVVDYLRARSRRLKNLPPCDVDIERMVDHVRLNVRPDLRDALIEVSDGIEKLEQIDPHASRVAELRLFGGFKMREIAEIVGRPLRTVERDWAYARARLRRWLD